MTLNRWSAICFLMCGFWSISSVSHAIDLSVSGTIASPASNNHALSPEWQDLPWGETPWEQRMVRVANRNILLFRFSEIRFSVGSDLSHMSPTTNSQAEQNPDHLSPAPPLSFLEQVSRHLNNLATPNGWEHCVGMCYSESNQEWVAYPITIRSHIACPIVDVCDAEKGEVYSQHHIHTHFDRTFYRANEVDIHFVSGFIRQPRQRVNTNTFSEVDQRALGTVYLSTPQGIYRRPDPPRHRRRAIELLRYTEQEQAQWQPPLSLSSD